jgi:hypothetical protein
MQILVSVISQKDNNETICFEKKEAKLHLFAEMSVYLENCKRTTYSKYDVNSVKSGAVSIFIKPIAVLYTSNEYWNTNIFKYTI